MIKNERLKISFFSRGILGNIKSVVANTIIMIDIIVIRLIFLDIIHERLHVL